MKQPIDIFDIARKAYPGVKRGLETEFKYFRKTHRDWRKVLLILMPAIEEQVKRREIKRSKNEFVPPWKNFKTWTYNRCWEESEGVTESPEERETRERIRKQKDILRWKQKYRDEHQSYLESKTTAALIDIKNDGGHLSKLCGWLIEEILQQRKGLGL